MRDLIAANHAALPAKRTHRFYPMADNVRFWRNADVNQFAILARSFL